MPSLPLELERLIFEMAALQEADHDRRVRIILVAKRVYEWIRPILYRVAIAQESKGALTIQNWRKAQIPDVAPFTRHLLINSYSHGVIELLSNFQHVDNLAVWPGPQFNHKELEKMNSLPLRTLSVVLGDISIDGVINYCPIIRTITRLEIISVEGFTWDDCKALAEFPKLTHLCFDIDAEVEDAVVTALLEHCPSLRAMVYQLSDGCTIDSELHDPRLLVLQHHMEIEDFIEEWERSANGGIGLWELADIIIEARKNKFFKDDSSFTFSRSTWMDSLNEDGVRWYKNLM